MSKWLKYCVWVIGMVGITAFGTTILTMEKLKPGKGMPSAIEAGVNADIDSSEQVSDTQYRQWEMRRAYELWKESERLERQGVDCYGRTLFLMLPNGSINGEQVVSLSEHNISQSWNPTREEPTHVVQGTGPLMHLVDPPIYVRAHPIHGAGVCTIARQYSRAMAAAWMQFHGYPQREKE